MELNEYENQMLDTLLAAFGPGNELTRAQVLDLFGGDETLATAMISFIISEGFIADKGDKLQRQAKATSFLLNGGFTGKASVSNSPSWPAWDQEAFLKKNTELQNETLRLQRTLRDKESEFSVMSQKAASASFYQKAFYASIILLALLISWIIWLLSHN